MKKTLTSPGTITQWFKIINKSFELMRLDDVKADYTFFTVSARDKNNKHICIEINQVSDKVVSLNIDYDSESLLEDFKKYSIRVIEDNHKNHTNSNKQPQKKRTGIGLKIIIALVAVILIALLAVGAYAITYNYLYGELPFTFLQDKEYGVNEIAEVKGLNITLTGCQSINLQQDPNSLILFNPPEGYAFTGVGFKIENTGDKSYSVDSSDITVYCDGAIMSKDSLFEGFTTDGLLQGDIPPGGSLSGGIVYDFPSSWQTAEIYYRYDEDKEPLKFTATNPGTAMAYAIN